MQLFKEVCLKISPHNLNFTNFELRITLSMNFDKLIFNRTFGTLHKQFLFKIYKLKAKNFGHENFGQSIFGRFSKLFRTFPEKFRTNTKNHALTYF